MQTKEICCQRKWNCMCEIQILTMITGLYPQQRRQHNKCSGVYGLHSWHSITSLNISHQLQWSVYLRKNPSQGGLWGEKWPKWPKMGDVFSSFILTYGGRNALGLFPWSKCPLADIWWTTRPAPWHCSGTFLLEPCYFDIFQGCMFSPPKNKVKDKTLALSLSFSNKQEKAHAPLLPQEAMWSLQYPYPLQSKLLESIVFGQGFYLPYWMFTCLQWSKPTKSRHCILGTWGHRVMLKNFSPTVHVSEQRHV